MTNKTEKPTYSLYEQLWTKEGNIQMNIEEAERRGRSDEQIRISLSMLNDGVPPETVSKYTGLSLTDIQKMNN